jgi:hypothetical protein
VRAVPNREIAADWWVSPWGWGGTMTAAVGNMPGTTVTRSVAWTRGMKRKGASDALVAAGGGERGRER